MSEKKDYFDYIENVLGVKSILLSLQPEEDLAAVALLICVEDYVSYNAEEKELLAKMIASLKIDLQKIKVMPLAESEKCNSEFTIYFLDNLNIDFNKHENSIVTYSPRILIKKSDLKKNVWSDLQKVIAHFKPAK